MFSYVYYWTYISNTDLTVGDVLDKALRLDDSQQLELFCQLGNLLVGERLLPGAALCPSLPCTALVAASRAACSMPLSRQAGRQT